MRLLSLNIIIEIICFIIAFYCLKSDKNRFWKYQVVFMAITVITELTGRYLSVYSGKDNQWLYNLFLIAELSGIMSMFYNILVIPKKILFIYAGIFVFTVVYIIDLVTHGFGIYNDNCDTAISVYYCFCCLYYYYFLLNEEKHEDLKRLAAFWWVNGALFYYFGNIVCDLFFYKLMQLQHINPRYYVISFLNIILYGCWSYAYICRYRHRKLSN